MQTCNMTTKTSVVIGWFFVVILVHLLVLKMVEEGRERIARSKYYFRGLTVTES